VAIVAAATIATEAFRRPDQFSHPAVWDESGAQILPQYLRHGFLSLVEPVNGYLVLPAKLVDILAWKLSATHYPEIAFSLTILVQILVLCCIALAPTTLRHPLLCAVLPLAVPTDPETFGVSLYLLWWGTLLLVPAVLWDERRSRRVWPRMLMVVVGALSSPTIVAVLPLFVWRWWKSGRQRRELAVLLVASACGAVQAWLVLAAGAGGAHLDLRLGDAPQVVGKFFGLPFVATWSWDDGVVVGVGVLVLAVLVAGAISLRRAAPGTSTTSTSLAYLTVAAIGMSLCRAPIEAVHPVLAGPRYFFYPYVFLAWLLLQHTGAKSVTVRVVATVLLSLAALQAVLIGPRHHDDLPWAESLMACAGGETPQAITALPVHYDGVAERAWHVDLTTAECRRLVDGGILHRLDGT